MLITQNHSLCKDAGDNHYNILCRDKTAQFPLHALLRLGNKLDISIIAILTKKFFSYCNNDFRELWLNLNFSLYKFLFGFIYKSDEKTLEIVREVHNG